MVDSLTYDLPLQGFKISVLAVFLVGVVPLLIGLLFEQTLVAPLRVPLNQSPVFFAWQVSCSSQTRFSLSIALVLTRSVMQDWALGVLHTKIICGLTLMGPNWWLKRHVEEVTLTLSAVCAIESLSESVSFLTCRFDFSSTTMASGM